LGQLPPHIAQSAGRRGSRRPFGERRLWIEDHNLKVFGVSLSLQSDRPCVFVRLETNQGVIGWGEATLEGKAGAVLACVEDFRELLIGYDPMRLTTIALYRLLFKFLRFHMRADTKSASSRTS